MQKDDNLVSFYEEFDDFDKSLFQLIHELPFRTRSSFVDTKGAKNPREDVGDGYFQNIEPSMRADLIICRNYLRNAYFSIVGQHAVVSDIDKCAQMVNRYPWHGTNISKGDHFDFVWFSFVNHCYIFEERTKQVGKHLNVFPKSIMENRLKSTLGSSA